MSFTRRISQLLTSFCHSGDLAAGGGFGNGHRIPIRYTLEVEETACIYFFQEKDDSFSVGHIEGVRVHRF